MRTDKEICYRRNKLDISSPNDKEELLYSNIKGYTATGKRTANSFVVFAGSQAVLKHLPSGK